jgi:putative aminopeptidase FrvX
MRHRASRTIGALAVAVWTLVAVAGAADLRSITRELFAIPSTTGSEGLLAADIMGLLPKGLPVETDGLGTIAVRIGGGGEPILVLAALDGYGHMVSGITPEGVLTLDRPVPAPNARFDAFLLGQPVIISTSKGPVQGVVAQPAMHLLTPERRRLLVDGFSLETAFVDIGVRSAKEARAKGVELLDPVTYPAVLTELAGDNWAGPGLGSKAAAAGLVAAAQELAGPSGAAGSILVWAAQTKFMARGRGPRRAIGAIRAKARWRPARVIIVDVIAAGEGEGSPTPGLGPVLAVAKDGPSSLRQAAEEAAAATGASLQVVSTADSPLTLPFADGTSEVVRLALPVRFLNTPSEVIAFKDLQALHDILERVLRPGEMR